MNKLLEIVKAARPGFWPTHIWFYLLPFSQQNMFGSVPFWLGAVYVCFPLGLLLYGWNDIGDSETDKDNARKGNWLFGAKPDAQLRKQLPWIIAVIQIPFLIAFVWFADWKMLAWFVSVLLVNASYNQFEFKRMPWLDLINQVGYLLIFVLASWLCSVEQLNGPAMLFSALFAMQSHLFGQIMDVEEDRLSGRNTTAVAIGVFWSKLLLSLIMLGEALIAVNFFNGRALPLFMVTGTIFFFADAFVGPKKYPLAFLKIFFIGWNAIAIASMYFVWRDGVFVLGFD